MALLCRDGMGGFGGVSKSAFYRLSYREIFESYFAEFDGDHHLVPLRHRYQQMRMALGTEVRSGNGKVLTLEELAIPPAVLSCGVPLDFTRLWWSVWRRRDLYTTEQLEEKWWQEMRQAPPLEFREPRRA